MEEPVKAKLSKEEMIQAAQFVIEDDSADYLEGEASDNLSAPKLAPRQWRRQKLLSERCFVCGGQVLEGRRVSSTWSIVSQTSYVHCVAQLVGEAFEVVASPEDMVCHHCCQLLDQRDQLVADLARVEQMLRDHLYLKYSLQGLSPKEIPLDPLQSKDSNLPPLPSTRGEYPQPNAAAAMKIAGTTARRSAKTTASKSAETTASGSRTAEVAASGSGLRNWQMPRILGHSNETKESHAELDNVMRTKKFKCKLCGFIGSSEIIMKLHGAEQHLKLNQNCRESNANSFSYNNSSRFEGDKLGVKKRAKTSVQQPGLGDTKGDNLVVTKKAKASVLQPGLADTKGDKLSITKKANASVLQPGLGDTKGDKLVVTRRAKASVQQPGSSDTNNLKRKVTVHCKLCKVSLPTTQAYWRHLMYHSDPDNAILCCDCGESSENMAALKVHMSQVHQCVASCKYCGQQFKSEDELKTHEINHSECIFCGKCFKNSFVCNEHIKKFHVESKCDQCDQTFKNLNLLSNHIKRVHAESQKFVCKECLKVLKNERCYATHMLQHTGDFKYKCNVCSKGFTSKVCHTEHMNSLHSSNPINLYTCETCGKQFKHIWTFKTHCKWHIDPYPAVCQYCGLRLRYPQQLKIHIRRVHTGEKPFECSYCGKCYVTKISLQAHLSKHTGVYFYHCKDCNKGFNKGMSLKMHRHKMHGDPEPQVTKKNKWDYKMVIPDGPSSLMDSKDDFPDRSSHDEVSSDIMDLEKIVGAIV